MPYKARVIPILDYYESGGGGGGAPSGPAGGDLGGTYPNPVVLHTADSFQANVTPTGTRPTTSFTVPQLGGNNPVAILLVLNGLTMDQVGSPAAADEFSINFGTRTITTNRTIVASDKFKAFLWY